jgi:hypothetical protein
VSNGKRQIGISPNTGMDKTIFFIPGAQHRILFHNCNLDHAAAQLCNSLQVSIQPSLQIFFDLPLREVSIYPKIVHINSTSLKNSLATFLSKVAKLFGGAYWTRTSDPIDVNDVLYQLSQSTASERDLS